MKILLLAPQPFYGERGTPIAVRLAAETLCTAGHSVDLLTYHLGEDIAYPGLRLFRIAKPPGITRVSIGFSPGKIVCDVWMAAAGLRLLRKYRHDVIHAVEEAVYIGLMLRRAVPAKLVYDMDSSIPEQMIDKWPMLGLLGGVMNAMEKYAFAGADLILPVCDALADRARRAAPCKPLAVVHDVAFEHAGGEAADLRRQLDLSGPFALYIGNLEPYQGIDLALSSLAAIRDESPLSLVIIGGLESDIRKYKNMSAALGIADRVHFVGPRPLSDLQGYLRQADILLSPRIKGTNTPMKVYSYMLSGKAILATNIRSHTQALDGHSALLVDPTLESCAAGLRKLSDDPGLRERLGAHAAAVAAALYSRAAFEARLLEAYRAVAPNDTDTPAPAWREDVQIQNN